MPKSLVVLIILLISNTCFIFASSQFGDTMYKRCTSVSNIVIRNKTNIKEQFIHTNTTYIINSDIYLSSKDTLVIPDNSVIKFKGGVISGGGSIIGSKTEIKADISRIFSPEMRLAGTWKSDTIYPEWFGATGDGVTDDTKAIRAALSAQGFTSCVFQDKIYIINAEKLSDSYKLTAIFTPVKPDRIYGLGNATIKLGKGNCDIPNGRGFASIFYISGHRRVSVENLTFDYNYSQNKGYQLGGASVIVENNGQQCSILFNNTEVAVVRGCTFKEPSGNNVISMWFDKGVPISEFICENNVFKDCGKRSFYRKDGYMVDAYHDVSVIGVHFNKESRGHGKARAIIRNNVANGAGGNAYDFCECHADEVVFSNNTIKDFAYCFMPLCAKENVSFLVQGNKFLNCIAAVHFWNKSMDGFEVKHGTYGFSELKIVNNIILLDFKKWFEAPLYNTLKKDSSNLHYSGAPYYGAVSQAGRGEKHIDRIEFANNTVDYVNIKDIPNKYFKTNFFATINFFSTPGQTGVDNIINECVIQNNRFIDVPNIVLRNNSYNMINRFVFSKNVLQNVYTNPNFNNRIHGGGLLSDIVYGGVVEGKVYKRKLGSATIISNKVVVDKGNRIRRQASAILGFIRNDSIVENGKFEIRDNICDGENYRNIVEICSPESVTSK